MLGSIVTGVYRDFTGPAGTPAAAHESLGGAVEVAATCRTRRPGRCWTPPVRRFVDGLTLAAGVGAAVLLAAAGAAWFLLRGQRLEDGVEHP